MNDTVDRCLLSRSLWIHLLWYTLILENLLVWQWHQYSYHLEEAATLVLLDELHLRQWTSSTDAIQHPRNIWVAKDSQWKISVKRYTSGRFFGTIASWQWFASIDWWMTVLLRWRLKQSKRIKFVSRGGVICVNVCCYLCFIHSKMWHGKQKTGRHMIGLPERHSKGSSIQMAWNAKGIVAMDFTSYTTNRKPVGLFLLAPKTTTGFRQNEPSSSSCFCGNGAIHTHSTHI